MTGVLTVTATPGGRSLESSNSTIVCAVVGNGAER